MTKSDFLDIIYKNKKNKTLWKKKKNNLMKLN